MTIEPIARTAAGSIAAARGSFSPLLHRVRRRVGGQPLAPPAASEQGWRPPILVAWSAADDSLLGSPGRTAPGERIETQVMTDGLSAPLVELRVTPELSVTLGRNDAGVTVHIDAAPLQVAPAEAALPRLVAALRTRGLAVSQANLQVTGGRPRPR